MRYHMVHIDTCCVDPFGPALPAQRLLRHVHGAQPYDRIPPLRHEVHPTDNIVPVLLSSLSSAYPLLVCAQGIVHLASPGHTSPRHKHRPRPDWTSDISLYSFFSLRRVTCTRARRKKLGKVMSRCPEASRNSAFLRTKSSDISIGHHFPEMSRCPVHP